MKQPTGKLAMAYQTIARMEVEIENLRTVQRASFNASGQIKAAASELGFNPAQEEGALEYLIGLAREVPGLRAKAGCVDDCAHLIRKLVHCRRQLATDEALAQKALDYLKRKGLQGSPLRADEG